MIMKRNICGIVLGAMLFAFATEPAAAQEYTSTPVEISKEKVRIDGKLCYSHIVLEKQTLYSISKAYGVSIDEIYKFNPSVKENGLKKNSIIIIPSQDVLKGETAVQKAVLKPSKEEESVPASSDKATEVTTAVKKEVPAEKEKSVRIHIAKWYEDLDVIAAQYDIAVEDIMKANNLKGRKLGKRQKLIIPYPEKNTVQTPEIQIPEETNEPVIVEEVVKDVMETVDSVITLQPKDEIKATMFLPLTNKEGEPNRNNIDFYCGALMAVYDMAKAGIGCKLNVYDISGNDFQYNGESLKDNDLIIGPVSTAGLTRLFNAVGNSTLVVSPLDPRAENLVGHHSTMVQIPTPQTVQYRDLAKWMEEDYKEGDRAVMITEKGARQSAITNTIKEALDSSLFAYNIFSYSILEGRDVTEALTELMTPEGANRVIIASESEAFVNDVIRNLNLLIYNNLEIVLYAPSKTRSFETIEVENLHKTSMHVSLAYHIDYEDQRVKEFLLKYRALFNTEPNQFAFQGYDVARFFIDLCSKYGDKWAENIENADTQMLQSTFNIRRQLLGGYTNNGVRRIVYENGYSVKKEK